VWPFKLSHILTPLRLLFSPLSSVCLKNRAPMSSLPIIAKSAGLSLFLGAALTLASFIQPAIAGNAAGYHLGNQPCWDEASRYSGVDPWLLYSLAEVESNYNASAIGKNRNGTYDIGLMQINSSHLSELREYGIPRSALLNACASTYIGAWIMARNFRRYGQSWKAIAAYNVGTIDSPRRTRIGYAYAKRVYTAYRYLVLQNERRAITDQRRPLVFRLVQK
jgi:soluble lytic murein transglycosylase-like protein